MDLQLRTAAKFLLFFIGIISPVTATTYPRNETDHLALLNIKLQISNDPKGVLKSWNDSIPHCQWEGVTCGVRHQRVTNLSLPGKSLLGSISPYIGNLSFLKTIHLGDNRFQGEIPQEIGRLLRLKNLNLSSNTLSGEIPVNLSQCSELRFMSILHNRLVGKIPTEIGFLKKLETLILAENNLIKQFPSSFGNLSSLTYLSVAYNNLEGSLPDEIGYLRNLWRLSVHQNRFSGVFPPSIYNISSLSQVSLTKNFLQGKLPNDIGLKLPNLQFLYIGGNLFFGEIPSSIINATNLQVLDLGMNKFEGQVPIHLGNLQKLQFLSFSKNILGHNATGDLHFITSLTNCTDLYSLTFDRNNFGGQLPQRIGNLSVENIAMGGNKISGTIPISLMRLPNLYALGMEENFFTGTIPRDIGKLQTLQALYIGRNMLIGEIPSTLCNLTSIYLLSLDTNGLEGILPPCLGNSQSLKIFQVFQNKLSGIISPEIFGNSFSPTNLDISYNSFTGPFPPEVGKLANILSMNVSYNNFSGQIPATIGDCLDLQQLIMRGNSFQGTIPPKLASLKAIEYLDLSKNNLSGQIPKDLEQMPSLKYLNLSFNNLEGEVPRDGVFANSSQVMLEGNFNLCGGIPEFQLPSCPNFHKKKNWKLLIIITASSVFTLILVSTTLLFHYRRRYQKNDSFTRPTKEDKFLRISYHELQRATGGFSEENIVGSGGSGVVYKGQLDQLNGKLVGVKVLDVHKNGVSKSFKAECNALRNIRHRNLVSILSYCSSIDFKGQEFKALVYEFMENGSLDTWLHPPRTFDGMRLRNLNLLQRLNIAIDVAYALQYLHHHGGVVIAHCDVKPSNILLDNDLTAHVGDFGLARLISKASSVSGASSSVVIKGTIGYAAPEYAMGYKASTEADVYSYGIVLLEMLTGKKPTDESFSNDLNLHNYVKKNLLVRVEEILDPFLRSRQGEENSDDVIMELQNSNQRSASLSRMMSCTISIFEIGLKCSEISPNDRLDMNEATRQLLVIRDTFLHIT